jgi:hypothetical protein
MLQPFPTLTQEMDFYDISRECWQCKSYKSANGTDGKCTSREMRESIERFVGVTFTDAFIVPVNQDTDAASCVEYELKDDADTVEQIVETIEEKASQYRAHADHYNHLRRPAHAY